MERPPEPRIGEDAWVALAAERTTRPSGLRGALQRRHDALSPSVRLALLVLVAGLVPLVHSDYIVRVGVNTLIYALLAVGLNVVVGYAGLLDLGYVAFFGFGAYVYALLSSGQFDIHWPTIATIPVVIAASALLGLLVGLPSRRLVGDYLAIVTLFFAQIFVTLATNANRITPPGHDAPVDFTGGPNGIAGVDNLAFFGLVISSVRDYYYFTLAALVAVLVCLYNVANSRTGRAWASMREDHLAAQLMGTPTSALKLLAFVFGAVIAGFTGTIFAALQVGVFPANFDLALLITLYAMVILGGAGSLGGVLLGVVSLNVVLEILRTPENSRLLFLAVLLVALLVWLRPWGRLAAVLAGTFALGLAISLVAERLIPGSLGSAPPGASVLNRVVDRWVVVLDSPERVGNIGYAVLFIVVIALTRVGPRARTLLLVPGIYLAVFVWENRLVENPSVTRLIVLGWLLVVLMNVRPQGLLGKQRVEIV